MSDLPTATTREPGTGTIVHRWREGHVPPVVAHEPGEPCRWCDAIAEQWGARP